MSKFSIPELEGYKVQGEELYQAIRKLAAKRYPLGGDRRIRSLTFRDINLGRKKGKVQTLTATVGREDPYDIRDLVVAILESTKYSSDRLFPPSEGYLIYTIKRGLKTNDPYEIPTSDEQDVEYFDA
jgi:hypothetical protein